MYLIFAHLLRQITIDNGKLLLLTKGEIGTVLLLVNLQRFAALLCQLLKDLDPLLLFYSIAAAFFGFRKKESGLYSAKCAQRTLILILHSLFQVFVDLFGQVHEFWFTVNLL